MRRHSVAGIVTWATTALAAAVCTAGPVAAANDVWTARTHPRLGERVAAAERIRDGRERERTLVEIALTAADPTHGHRLREEPDVVEALLARVVGQVTDEGVLWRLAHVPAGSMEARVVARTAIERLSADDRARIALAHRVPEHRATALAGVSDQQVLAEIATRDHVSMVRQAALARITDRDLFSRALLAAPDADLWIPVHAARRFVLLEPHVTGDVPAMHALDETTLIEWVAPGSPRRARLAAVSALPSAHPHLVRIVRGDADPLVRLAALRRLATPEGLREAAMDDPEPIVRLGAVALMQDHGALARIAASPDEHEGIRLLALRRLSEADRPPPEEHAEPGAPFAASDAVGEAAQVGARALQAIADVEAACVRATDCRLALGHLGDDGLVARLARSSASTVLRAEALRRARDAELVRHAIFDDESADVRAVAVALESDPVLLARVVRDDPSVRVRVAALARLDPELRAALAASEDTPRSIRLDVVSTLDPASLAEVLHTTRDPHVRRAVLERGVAPQVLAEIVGGHADTSIRADAAEHVHDAAWLEQLTLREREPDVLLAALPRVKDRLVLRQVALDEDHPVDVRVTAARAIGLDREITAIGFACHGGDSRSCARLDRRARSSDEPERRAQAVGWLRDAGTLRSVAWADSDPDVRLAAALTSEEPRRLAALLGVIVRGDGKAASFIRNEDVLAWLALHDRTSGHALARVTDRRVLEERAAGGDRGAALRLGDPKRLARLAMKGESWAAGTVKDVAVLAALVERAPKEEIRRAAAERLPQEQLASLFRRASWGGPRLSIVSVLEDRALLAEIARGGCDPDVRIAALERLDDPRLFAELATADGDPGVRSAATLEVDAVHLPAIAGRAGEHEGVRMAAIARLPPGSALTEAEMDSSAVVRGAARGRSRQLSGSGPDVVSAEGCHREAIKAVARICATEQPAACARLTTWARGCPGAFDRSEAVRALVDPSVLLDVARHDASPDVKLAALERLPESLRNEVAQELVGEGVGEAVHHVTEVDLLDRLVWTLPSPVGRLRAAMSLARLEPSGPMWPALALGHRDADVRTLAVRLVADSTTLGRVATTDESVRTRQAAVERLSEPRTIAEVALTDVDGTVRLTAARRLLDAGSLVTAAEGAASIDARLTAITVLGEYVAQAERVRQAREPAARRSAVLALRREATLRSVAGEDPDASVREAAAERLGRGTAFVVGLERAEAVLSAIAWNELDPEIRDVALDALPQAERARIATSHPDPFQRRAAVLRLRADQGLLLRTAQAREEHDLVRVAAVRRIEDPEPLASVAIDPAANVALALAIVERLSERRAEATLAVVARLAPSEAVRELAVARLTDERLLEALDGDQVREAAEARLRLVRAARRRPWLLTAGAGVAGGASRGIAATLPVWLLTPVSKESPMIHGLSARLALGTAGRSAEIGYAIQGFGAVEVAHMGIPYPTIGATGGLALVQGDGSIAGPLDWGLKAEIRLLGIAYVGYTRLQRSRRDSFTFGIEVPLRFWER